MSGRAWTPGPWSADELPGIVRINARNGTVCELHHVGWRPDITLIAAAPDMAEALASVIAANDEFRATGRSLPMDEAIDAARAALSKAEGGSHG